MELASLVAAPTASRVLAKEMLAGARQDEQR